MRSRFIKQETDYDINKQFKQRGLPQRDLNLVGKKYRTNETCVCGLLFGNANLMYAMNCTI